jgi:ribosomal protein L13E
MCDVMHPRLKDRAGEWSRQYVLFETQNSYPMFIMTLTKTRASPYGPQQMMDAGFDVNRMKLLGVTASDVRALGHTVQQMRGAGWALSEMKDAGFDAGLLLGGGCSASELRSAGVTASQLKDAGCSCRQLKDTGFSASELKSASFDLASLIAGGHDASELKSAAFTASDVRALGHTVQQMRGAGWALSEMKDAGFDAGLLLSGGCSASELRSAGFTASQLKDGGCGVQELKSGGFSVQELISAGYDLSALIGGGFGVGDMKGAGVTASQFKDAGCGVQELKSGGFSVQELMSAGYDLSALIAGGFSVEEMKGAGVTASQFKDAGCSLSKLAGSAFSNPELLAAGFNMAEMFSIVAADADPATLAQAQLYYRDVEFASQLCSEFAAAERGDAELSSRLSQAHDALQLIVDHNTLLRSPPFARQPPWPRHEALVRFDLPLQRLTTHLLVSKKWFQRNMSLRGSRLYYSDGNNGHPDTAAGTQAYVQSNPAPDGHYCVDLKGACACCVTSAFCCASQTLLGAGCSVAPCRAAVDGQAFAFEIKFSAGPKVRARFFSMCVRITLRAAGCEGRVPGCRRRRDAPALRAHHRSRERLLLPA